MSFNPPGVSAPQTLGPGVYPACILVSIEQAKPSSTGKYQIAYVAVYRDTESALEVTDWIKWDGSRRDFYAGLRIERLHAIIGADLPPEGHHPNFKELLELSTGVYFTVETEQNGEYVNIKDVRASGTEETI
ncbi:MAG: hypothetical protein ABFE02_12290 [Sulfuricella sp.]